MSSYNEQIANSSRANADAVSQIATVIAEASKRLFELQTEAAREAFAENSKTLKGLLSPTDSAAALAEWPRLFLANARRISEVTRSWFEVVSQTQVRIAQLMGESFSVYNQGTQQNLDQFTNAANEMRDAAATEVKDFLAKAGEDVSGAAKKQKSLETLR